MASIAMSQPPWLRLAWAELGQREVPGRATNPRIAGYIRRLGHAALASDDTAWCAAFVGDCLERAGLASTRSLMARSYLGWGTVARDAQVGDVAVLTRGSDPAAGHVGFVVGLSDSGLVLLGGNQSNAVTVETFAVSRLVGLRRPPFEASAPEHAPAEAVDGSVFARALAAVLALEGGWSDDPFDPGGPTNKGITLATFAREAGVPVTAETYDDLKLRLRSISDALVERIYRERYWRPARCAEMPPALAHFHFDASVNQGVSGAARMLQQALSVAVDGEIGPITLAAVRARPVDTTLARYADIRRRHYRSLPHFWRFGRGWLARVDTALAKACEAANPREAAAVPTHHTLPERQPKETATMPDTTQLPLPAESVGKWWGNSLTIWGALMTAVSTVLPAVLAAFGIEVSASLIERLGSDIATAIQAVGGLVGTLMTIFGRIRAREPLERRPVALKL